MTGPLLNLSRSPFLNRRPVRRFCLVLWLLGIVLVTLNVTSYLRNRSGSTDLRAQLRGLQAEIESVGGEIEGLQATLVELGPERQNSRVMFLNERIAERTFPWGELFDDLGEVLPRKVRLRNLNPKVDAAGSGRNAPLDGEPARRRVSLALQGVAKSDNAVYDLLDALFAHPSFTSPELNNERRQDSSQISFVIHVVYLPGTSPAAAKLTSDEPGESS